LILVVTILVLPAAAYIFSDHQPRVYKSQALMRISAPPDVSQLLTAAPTVPDPDATRAAARLFATTAVAADVAKRLGLPTTAARALLAEVTVSADDVPGFLTITAQANDPQRASRIANAFADTVVARRSRATDSQFTEAIGQLNSNRADVPGNDPEARKQLSQEIQRLRALKAAQGTNARTIEPAVADPAAISPKPVRTTALAFIVALLIAVALVLLAENIDRRVRQVGEFEELTGLPLLTLLPQSAFGAPLDARTHQQQFQLLRAGLTYFNIERTLTSLVVTSAMQGEGKTTVASNLACAFARVGRRVVVVDADLRRPRLHEAFGVRNLAGLGAVLVEDRTLEETLIPIEVPDGTEGASLHILPAGPSPPNPSELLASERVKEIVEELRGMADLVIFDTSPVLAVADALPLIEIVGGVVVIVRLNETTRDATIKLRDLLTAAHGRICGLVVTGAKQADGAGYGYGYGYSADQPSTGRGLLGRLRGSRPRDSGALAGSPEGREKVTVDD